MAGHGPNAPHLRPEELVGALHDRPGPTPEMLAVERLETDYPANGFPTQMGKVVPFYGRRADYVVVGGRSWLTAEEARHAAAALLTVADALEDRARG